MPRLALFQKWGGHGMHPPPLAYTHTFLLPGSILSQHVTYLLMLLALPFNMTELVNTGDNVAPTETEDGEEQTTIVITTTLPTHVTTKTIVTTPTMRTVTTESPFGVNVTTTPIVPTTTPMPTTPTPKKTGKKADTKQ